jgi:hypothetical protein
MHFNGYCTLFVTILFDQFTRFCEVSNYSFELNVCRFVTKKIFKKKIVRGVLQGNKYRIPKKASDVT